MSLTRLMYVTILSLSPTKPIVIIGPKRSWSDYPWKKHENFVSNSEWDWKNYSYKIENVTSLVRNGLTFSQLIIDFEVKRNEPFYAMTLFVPMLILTSLAPIGLILPGKRSIIHDRKLMKCNLVEAGEKMGLQITVLLADIIYVEVLQSTVPVFDSLGTFDLFFVFSTKNPFAIYQTYQGNSPLILTFFIVSIVLLCGCLLITTHTLFLYHCSAKDFKTIAYIIWTILYVHCTFLWNLVVEYEAINFSTTEAKFSRGLAKFFSAISCRIWVVEVPEVTNRIADRGMAKSFTTLVEPFFDARDSFNMA